MNESVETKAVGSWQVALGLDSSNPTRTTCEGVRVTVPPSRWCRLANLTPFVVGGLLLLAAALKTEQLFQPAAPATDLFGSRWFRVALIDVEILCGFALLIGIAPRITRRVCQLLFAGFFAYSVFQIGFGAKACGCLGRVDIGNAGMAGLDSLVLGALWAWRPVAGNKSRFRLVLPFMGVFCLALLPTWVLFAAPVRTLPLEGWPATVDLGTVYQGEQHEFSVQLRNLSDEAVIVHHIQVSCPCLLPGQNNLVLEPMGYSNVPLHMDLSKEVDFTGSLLIELKGLLSSEQVAFIMHVKVFVLPKNEQLVRADHNRRMRSQTRLADKYLVVCRLAEF